MYLQQNNQRKILRQYENQSLCWNLESCEPIAFSGQGPEAIRVYA